MHRIAAGVAQAFGVTIEVVITRGVTVTRNHPAEAATGRRGGGSGRVCRCGAICRRRWPARISAGTWRNAPARSSGSATAPPRAGASCTAQATISTTRSCRPPPGFWPASRSEHLGLCPKPRQGETPWKPSLPPFENAATAERVNGQIPEEATSHRRGANHRQPLRAPSNPAASIVIIQRYHGGLHGAASRQGPG